MVASQSGLWRYDRILHACILASEALNRQTMVTHGMKMIPTRSRARPILLILASLLTLAGSLPRAQVGKARRDEFLAMFARSYYPGRSAQVMIVPREYEILTRKDESYLFMHGSPWDYDIRIPYILYGPPFVHAGSYPEVATHQDMAPTLAATMHLALPSTITGHVLQQAIDPTAEAPRVIFLAVLDAMRADYLDDYAASLPTLSRLRREGAWFPNARVNYLPSATAVAHSTISTGSDPRVHGIVVNTQYDRVRNRPADVFPEKDVSTLMVPTIADEANVSTNGRSIIYAQAGLYYAAAGLAGHGGCFWNGRPVMAVSYDQDRGTWATNPECFRMPEYLASLNSRPLWESAGGTWRGHNIANPTEIRRSALFPKFEAEALVSVIEHEPIGADQVTDLLLANLKSLDFVGHKYGPGSVEIADTLAEMDRQLGRIVDALDRKVGRGGYVIAITADHGMPPEPSGGRGGRHTEPEMLALLHQKFDPAGKLFRVYEAANSQIFVDTDRMRELGVTLKQIAQYLEDQPFIYAAYSEDEVQARAAATPTDP